MRFEHIVFAAVWAWSCQAAIASTPYQSGATGSSCSGKTTCTLTFATVSSGESLTIEHASCNASAANFAGVFDASLYAESNPSIVDSLATQLVTGTGNAGVSIVDSQTVFFVGAADTPAIALIANGHFSGTPVCLVSGHLSKVK